MSDKCTQYGADGALPPLSLPRTRRGREKLRAIMDAALAEFGEKGFHEGSISGISRRCGLALGGIYNYFKSKEEVFRALMRDISIQTSDYVAAQVRTAPDEIAAERLSLAAAIRYVRSHKGIYRIISDAEFVDPEGHRALYERAVERVLARLSKGVEKGEIRSDVDEIHAWAIVGMNVALGLRFGAWNDDRVPEDVAEVANEILRRGLAPQCSGAAES